MPVRCFLLFCLLELELMMTYLTELELLMTSLDKAGAQEDFEWTNFQQLLAVSRFRKGQAMRKHFIHCDHREFGRLCEKATRIINHFIPFGRWRYPLSLLIWHFETRKLHDLKVDFPFARKVICIAESFTVERKTGAVHIRRHDSSNICCCNTVLEHDFFFNFPKQHMLRQITDPMPTRALGYSAQMEVKPSRFAQQ